MRKCVVQGRQYSVSYVFNMVGNYYFTRKGVDFLVDAWDVSEWAEENKLRFENGIEAAIAFAKEVATEGGEFWWKVREA